MSNARKLADNLPREGSTANRRLTNNGAMEVFQRGEATGITATAFRGPDRCRIILSGAGGYTITQASDAPTGFQKSFHVNNTSAGAYSSAANVNHLRFSSVEDQDCVPFNYGTSSAKQLTLQFWAKCTYADTFTVALVNHSAQRSNFQRFTIDSANTWQKFEFTFVGDTGGSGFDNDNTLGLSVDVFLAGGSSYRGGSKPVNTWDTRNNNQSSYVTASTNFGSSTAHNIYFTGVQLEVGNVATPFEYRPFADELIRCYRYLELTDQNQEIYGMGAVWTTGAAYGIIPFKVTKRAPPSSLGRWKGASTDYRFRTKGNNYGLTSLTLSNPSAYGCRFDLSSSGFSIGDSGWLSHSGNTTQLYFESEI